ncbi:MAG: SUMF1/EgtB/PvdO family nonheme iron enzyme [Chitinivibrionales bacterium]|nr:SUMF1/EgtB/PvdO family nonheme iron enzyme [Chitinivibrionales bacterium]
MKLYPTILISIFLLANFSFASKKIVEQHAFVNDFTGNAQMKPAGSNSLENVSKGVRLKMGTELTTAAGAMIEINFESGVTAVVGEKSNVILSKLLENQELKAMRTRLNLKKGHLWIEMPSYKESKGWFDVETDNALVFVRKCVVKIFIDDDETCADVYRGAAKIREKEGGAEQVVIPGKRGIAQAGKGGVELVQQKKSLAQIPSGLSEFSTQYKSSIQPDEIPISIAMLSMHSNVASKQDLVSVSNYIATEIDKVSDIEVVFLDDVKAILRAEGLADIVECQTDSCLSKIGSILGVDLVVVGDIGGLGSRFVFNLTLIDVLRDQVKNRISEVVVDDVGLILDKIPGAIEALVPKELRKDFKAPVTDAGTDNGVTPPEGTTIPQGMAYIPGGSFEMGCMSGAGDVDEYPVHTVKVNNFFIDRYEVTKAGFERVMGYSTSTVRGCSMCPADNVSWHEANEYCRKLDKRLPTEAEWEYACRARTKSAFNFANTITSEMANFDGRKPFGGAKVGAFRNKLLPTGTFKPNAWGLYDMHGNVWEWCSDWYDRNYYKKSPKENPTGPKEGELKVMRGGGWISDGASCRSANRIGYDPSIRMNIFGIRCVKDAE